MYPDEEHTKPADAGENEKTMKQEKTVKPEKQEAESTTPAKPARKTPARMHTFICASGKNSEGCTVMKVLAEIPEPLQDAELVREIEKLGPGQYIVIKGRFTPASFTVRQTNSITIGE